MPNNRLPKNKKWRRRRRKKWNRKMLCRYPGRWLTEKQAARFMELATREMPETVTLRLPMKALGPEDCPAKKWLGD